MAQAAIVTELVLVWAPRADVPTVKRPYSLISAGDRQAVFFCIPAARQNFLHRICNLSHLEVVRHVTFERMKECLSAEEDERALASILPERRDDLTAGHRSSLMPPDSSGLSTTFKS